MTAYRRFYIPAATWFFTVNLAERKNNHLLVEHIDLTRENQGVSQLDLEEQWKVYINPESVTSHIA